MNASEPSDVARRAACDSTLEPIPTAEPASGPGCQPRQRLEVNAETLTAALFKGDRLVREFDRLDPLAARWLRILVSESGRYITGPQLGTFDPLLSGARPDRLLRRLPPGLQRLIQSTPRNGSRIVLQ